MVWTLLIERWLLQSSPHGDAFIYWYLRIEYDEILIWVRCFFSLFNFITNVRLIKWKSG